jgi:F-type H+-transporting ATPase subunit epsilon
VGSIAAWYVATPVWDGASSPRRYRASPVLDGAAKLAGTFPGTDMRSIVAKTLTVELVAVEEKVWTGQATMLVARTTEGELGVMPGHAPLLGQLADPGIVRIKREDGPELSYQVNGGFLSVTGDGATVLAETCEPTESRTAASAAGN